MKKFRLSRTLKIIVIVVLAISVTGAFLLTGGFGLGQLLPSKTSEKSPEKSVSQQQWWTCSMHPQIRRPEPGRCPICAMDLIPVSQTGQMDMSDAPVLVITEAEKKLAEIQTSPVERRFVAKEIRMVGKVDFDETRVKYITARVPGRLDKLFVDFTGTSIKKGDHLVHLYSPELITAQEELLQSLSALEEVADSDLDVIKTTATATVKAAREKLRLWGLTEEQIAEIEKQGTPSEHQIIYAPISGVVIHKNAAEGMYVETGTRIYTIADLSTVWVKLDMYESDVMWVQLGQEVTFTTQAYPGEPFEGTVAFIDPILDDKTRTVHVRVNADNTEGQLKPGMFVRAVVHSRLTADGRVYNGSLEESDTPDTDEHRDDTVKAPLVIPASAPLVTGKRAVVYVEIADSEKPTYEGREVVLGPRAGDYYLVKSGLHEGEKVVTKGNFKIDSSLEIHAKPSMMNPKGGVVSTGHNHSAMAQMEKAPSGENSGGEHTQMDMTQTQNSGSSDAAAETADDSESIEIPKEAKESVAELFSGYFDVATALNNDDMQHAVEGAERMQAALDVEADDNAPVSHVESGGQWMKHCEAIKESVEQIIAADDIGEIRKHFIVLSEAMTKLAPNAAQFMGVAVYRLHCPMARAGEGADWLQDREDVHNPYFGQSMSACGSVTTRYKTEPEEN